MCLSYKDDAMAVKNDIFFSIIFPISFNEESLMKLTFSKVKTCFVYSFNFDISLFDNPFSLNT